jgi:hypothetical protein
VIAAGSRPWSRGPKRTQPYFSAFESIWAGESPTNPSVRRTG